MLKYKFLAHNQFKPSLGHREKDVEIYIEGVFEVFSGLKRDLDTKADLFINLGVKYPAPTIPRLTK
jgi:hypothetical protein